MAEKKNKANWQILEEQYYDRFQIFSVKKSRRVNPRSGKTIDFVLMDGLNWVSVLPLTTDNNVVLVRQYRHGIEDYTIETPGGCVEENELPAESARRELLEETGYRASVIEPLGIFDPNPPMYGMRCHSFVARNVEPAGLQQLDDGEDIQVLTRPLPEFLRMVRAGEVTHAIVMATVALFLLHHDQAG